MTGIPDRSTRLPAALTALAASVGHHLRVGLEAFEEMSDWLWWLAVAFFGVGDLLTTGFATSAGIVDEGSPLVNAILATHGLAGLFALKVLAFACAYVVWRSLRPPQSVTVPLAFAIMGLGLTTWNLFAIGYVLAG